MAALDSRSQNGAIVILNQSLKRRSSNRSEVFCSILMRELD